MSSGNGEKNMLNSVIIEGFIVKDAAPRQAGTKPDGTPNMVVDFAISCPRPETKAQRDARMSGQQIQGKSDFVNVTLWRNLSFEKGARVIVTGRFTSDSYDKDGQKIYKTFLAADEVEFITASSARKDASAVMPQTQQPQATMPQAPQMQPMQAAMPQMMPQQMPSMPQAPQMQATMPQQPMTGVVPSMDFTQATIPGFSNGAELPFN